MATLVDENVLHNVWLSDAEGIFIFHDEVDNTFTLSTDEDGINLINDIPASIIREIADDILD